MQSLPMSPNQNRRMRLTPTSNQNSKNKVERDFDASNGFNFKTISSS